MQNGFSEFSNLSTMWQYVTKIFRVLDSVTLNNLRMHRSQKQFKYHFLNEVAFLPSHGPDSAAPDLDSVQFSVYDATLFSLYNTDSLYQCLQSLIEKIISKEYFVQQLQIEEGLSATKELEFNIISTDEFKVWDK